MRILTTVFKGLCSMVYNEALPRKANDTQKLPKEISSERSTNRMAALERFW